MVAGPDPDPVLTRDELAAFQRQLTMLSDDGVHREHERCWRDAHYDGNRVPVAATIQQLVASWRVLRRFRKRRA